METSRGAMLPWRSSCDSCLVARAFFIFVILKHHGTGGGVGWVTAYERTSSRPCVLFCSCHF